MSNQYNKFLIKAGLISLPVVFIFIIYCCLDPFKVIRNYNSYYQSGNSPYVTLNMDYVSTETFINNNPTYNYNSFIFGNSRSKFYEMNTWGKYAKTEVGFHFDASDETLLGISRKLQFLHNNRTTISNALLILDYATLSQTKEKKGHLYISHPTLSNQSRFLFQLEFFKSFLNPYFLMAYMDFRITNKVKDYMKDRFLLNDAPIAYNPIQNEMKFSFFEETIKTNPLEFYSPKKMKVFYHRDIIQKYSRPVILNAQFQLLTEISEILKKDKCKIKIVISPLYNQLKLSAKDIKILSNLFGRENVFNFSGINFITNNYQNYYENSHYRPHVAEYIMKEIYK